MRQDREYQIYLALANYIRLKYPKIIWRFDQAGLNLSKAQAGKNKAIQHGIKYPDLFIAEPRGIFHGLYIEIKKERTVIYKKNGELVADKHIIAQADALSKLNINGYWADFGIGTVECIKIIDSYLK